MRDKDKVSHYVQLEPRRQGQQQEEWRNIWKDNDQEFSTHEKIHQSRFKKPI